MTSTSSANRLVVDASVATKWHLRDEGDLAPADALLREFRDGQLELLAPDYIRYEVPNAIRNALRTRRLTVIQARTAIAEFLNWNLLTVGDDALIIAAFEWAARVGCSLYDGMYLALAEAADCPHLRRSASAQCFGRSGAVGRLADRLWAVVVR